MNTCPVQIFRTQVWSFTHVLVRLPAETVTAKPQLECIRSPSVVEFASEDRDVPRQAAEAALSHGCGALVWLARALHTFFVLLCSKRHTKKRSVRAINQSIHFHFVGSFVFQNCTFSAFGHGTELPCNLSASIDVTPGSAVVVRVPEGRKGSNGSWAHNLLMKRWPWTSKNNFTCPLSSQ